MDPISLTYVNTLVLVPCMPGAAARCLIIIDPCSTPGAGTVSGFIGNYTDGTTLTSPEALSGKSKSEGYIVLQP